MITEADTCRKYVPPKLYAAGWSDDQISEQKSFTEGRILVVGTKARRRPGQISDYRSQIICYLYGAFEIRNFKFAI